MLSTPGRFRRAFFRLVGTEVDDPELDRRGEGAGEVADMCLTYGCWDAQRWMLKMGYAGWRKRSDPLEFETAEDGRGSVTELPEDFLRAWGRENRRRSALVQPDGVRWGDQVTAEQDHRRGDSYWIEGDTLCVSRLANIPPDLRLDFHYRHPEWTEDMEADDIDFPMEARPLVVAEAASIAVTENWVPVEDAVVIPKVERARAHARERARDVARPTKQPRQFRRPTRFGNRW